jgi:hypothetical protein
MTFDFCFIVTRARGAGGNLEAGFGEIQSYRRIDNLLFRSQSSQPANDSGDMLTGY